MSGAVLGLFDFESHKDLVSCIYHTVDRDKENVRSTLFNEAMETGYAVKKAARKHDIEPHVYDDAMEEFYKRTDAFVFELTVSHMRAACKKIDDRVLQSVGDFSKGDRILCLGDGIGTDSLRFATLGYDVTYFEFESPSYHFACRRFRRESVEEKIKIISDVNNIPIGKFDVVVNREVLEHVPEPLDIVGDIRKYLAEDGLAVITESFSRVEENFPTHLASNRDLSGNADLLFLKVGFSLLRAYPHQRPLVFRKTEDGYIKRYGTLLSGYHLKDGIRRLRDIY